MLKTPPRSKFTLPSPEEFLAPRPVEPSFINRIRPSSSVGIDPAFPRICGYRPAAGCGRISRRQRGGDVLMETGHAKKGKRRPTPRHRRPVSSAQPATLLPAVGAALSRPGAECAGRAGKFDEFPKNSIKFEKFLRAGYPISCYYSVSCFQISAEYSLG